MRLIANILAWLTVLAVLIAWANIPE